MEDPPVTLVGHKCGLDVCHCDRDPRQPEPEQGPDEVVLLIILALLAGAWIGG